MLKSIIGLVVLLGLVVGGLVLLRGPEVFTLDKITGPPLQSSSTGTRPATVGNAAGARSGDPDVPMGNSDSSALSTVVANAAGAVKAVAPPTFSSDPPAHAPPPPKLIDAHGRLSADQLKRYRVAVDSLAIQGCNGNGSFCYQLEGSRQPHTLRNGESITFANGLVLSARVSGYPNCRITLSDGATQVAELSSF